MNVRSLLTLARSVISLLLVALGPLVAFGQTQTQEYFSSGTFTVPAGVTSLNVYVWGGGGGGGGAQAGFSGNQGAGGGGGGGYSTAVLTVAGGQNYTITVGGAGSTGGDANGGAGGNSSVSGPGGSVTANGGGGGGRRNGAGGAAGTGNTFNGGAGQNGSSAPLGGAGGGGAGNNGAGTAGASGGTGGAGIPSAAPYQGGNGGAARTSGSGGGNAAQAGFYGGGGGGATRSGFNLGTQAGGAGRPGAVVVQWETPGCAGTPAPGTTTGAGSVVCAAISLGISNPAVLAGLTYQWESAPDVSGVPGTWAAIGGATNMTVSVLPAAATWYRCVATCANSGLSGTSSNHLVAVAAPAPGATNSTLASAAQCTPFTVSIGAIAGTNYQWQWSLDGVGGWTNFGTNAASQNLSGQPEERWYRCVVTCPVSGLSGTSTPVQVTWFGCIVIGTGTDIPAATGSGAALYPNPLQDYYEGQRAQYLYNAASMSALPSGATITGIGWQIPTGRNFTGHLIEGYTIKLANSTLANLNLGAWENVPTTHYGPTDYSYPANFTGIASFTLGTTMLYTGQGLLMEVCGGIDAGFSQNPAVQRTTGVGYDASHSYRADDVTGCGNATTTNTGASTTRPNLVIFYTPPPDCAGTPAPGNTTGAGTTCGEALLSLTGQASLNTVGGITYQWESAPTAGGPWDPVTGAVASTYQAQVQVSTWFRCTVTCTPSGLSAASTPHLLDASGYLEPFPEDFASVTYPPPGCWSRAGSTGTLSDRATVNGYGAAGTGSARFAFRNFAGGSAFLTTPLISGLESGDGLLRFDAAGTFSNISLIFFSATVSDMVYLERSSNGGQTWQQVAAMSNGSGGVLNTAPPMSGIGEAPEFTPSAAQWTSLEYTIPQGTNRLRLRGVGGSSGLVDGGGNSVYFDNLELLKPCEGIPDAGSAYIVGTPVGCVGQSQTMTVDVDHSDMLGIEYEWEWTPFDPLFEFWLPLFDGEGVNAATYTTAPQDGADAEKWYRLRVTCTNSSETTYSEPVYLPIFEPPVVSLTSDPADALICESGSVEITATSDDPFNDTYLWQPNTNISPDNVSPVVTVSPTTSTSYAVTVTGTSGCQTTDGLLVRVEENPVAATVASPLALCEDAALELTTTVSEPVPATDYSNLVTQSANSGAIALAIPDAEGFFGFTIAPGAVVQSDLTVTGTNYAPQEITVHITSTHPYNSDLEFWLRGPGGCGAMEVSTRNGGSQGFYSNAKFVAPPGALPAAPIFASDLAGTYRAEGNLNVGVNVPTVANYGPLSGCPVNGTWTLLMRDAINGNTGNLTNWQIHIKEPGSGDYVHTFISGPGTVAGPTLSGTSNSVAEFAITDIPPGVAHEYVVRTTAPSGCYVESSALVTVHDLPTADAQGPYGPVCLNGGTVTLNGTGTQGPGSGAWSGTGVTGNSFDPAAAGAGDHTLTFTWTDANGCEDTDEVTVTVHPLPVVVADPAGPLCVDAAAITLTASPVGGSWSGTGVSGATFDPAVAGPGTHTLTYSYTDGNGCTDTDAIDVVVNDLPTVTATAAGPFCVDAAPVALGGTPAGGTWTGTGVTGSGPYNFEPATAGAGTHTLTYTYTDGNGCTNSDQTNVTVNPLPTADAQGPYGPVCLNGGTVTLNGTGTQGPGSGGWSGTGVTGNNFDPAAAGAGDHTLTFTWTDANGCVDTDQVTVTVHPLPVVVADPAGPLCVDAAAITLTASPVGGSWSGTGVSGATFDPAVAGPGTHTLTYSYTDGNGCTDTDAIDVVVNDLPTVTATAAGPFCVDAAPVALGGTPAGGTWTGTGVTGSGPYNFEPATAGAGTHTLTYTYTDGNGCTNSDQTDVTVNPLPTVTATDPGPLCSNDAPVSLAGSPAGGDWSGTGVSGTGPYTFDPAAGTQTLTYTYADGNGCVNDDQVEVTVEPAPTATIGYPASPYVHGAGTATPDFTGTGGGTWSAVPAGLVIDAGTGVVDLATSLPGGYTVTYTVAPTAVCAGFSTNTTIEIRSVYYSQMSGDVSDPIWDIVTVGTPGPAIFNAYTTMVVQTGHLVALDADASVEDLAVDAGSTLTLETGNTLTVHGDQVFLNGTVTAQADSELELAGDAATTISGLAPQTLWHVTVNTASGTGLQADLRIQGTLQINAGEFDASTGALTLLSNATGTGRLGPVTGGAVFTGNLTQQRYIPAGATNWRLLGSAVGGRTVEDWDDDFITAGFIGSDYPGFDSPPGSGNLWPSVRAQDEPTMQGTTLGMNTGVADSNVGLSAGKGFAVWCGDALGGTAAFTIDVTGPPTIAGTPIGLPVSYTANAAPELKGWNLVSNPLPSAIAFDQIARTDVNNEYYVYDPATGNMAHWDGATSTSTPFGALDGTIASSQGFWLKATAGGASATLDETAKVTDDSGVFGGDGFATVPSVRLHMQGGNAFSDQAVVYFGMGTPAQDADDVLKIDFAHQQAPSIATLAGTGQVLMVNKYGAYATDIAIPVAVRAKVNGTYTISLQVANTQLSCLWLEDLTTGTLTPVTDGAQYSFTQTASTTMQERFVLHATAPLAFSAEDGLCGPASGSATVDVAGGPADVTWTTAAGTVLLEQPGMSGEATFAHIAEGQYTVRVSAPATVCTELVHDFSIDTEGQPVEATIVAPGTVLVDEAITFGSTGTPGVQYAWDFGDGNTSNAAAPIHSYTLAGTYVVTLTATLDGCSVTTTTTVVVTFSTGVDALSGTEPRVWGGRETFVVEHGHEGGLLTIEVVDASGRIWYAKDHAAVPGRILVPARELASGVWFVRLTHDGVQRTFRVPVVR